MHTTMAGGEAAVTHRLEDSLPEDMYLCWEQSSEPVPQGSVTWGVGRDQEMPYLVIQVCNHQSGLLYTKLCL